MILGLLPPHIRILFCEIVDLQRRLEDDFFPPHFCHDGLLLRIPARLLANSCFGGMVAEKGRWGWEVQAKRRGTLFRRKEDEGNRSDGERRWGAQLNRAPHPQIPFYGEGAGAGSSPFGVGAPFQAHDLHLPFRLHHSHVPHLMQGCAIVGAQ